jgi:hypothetical protein
MRAGRGAFEEVDYVFGDQLRAQAAAALAAREPAHSSRYAAA